MNEERTLAQRKAALLARAEPLLAKALRQQQRAEDAFVAADDGDPWGKENEDAAMRILISANDLVDYYRALVMEARYSSDPSDLAWLDL